MKRSWISGRWLALLGMLFGLMGITLSAQTNLIFIADELGNVGQYNTDTNTGSVLGSLAASDFTANQVIGLAYDSVSNSVLLFDRGANTVYRMDATTGMATMLFTTPGVGLQGGAVYGGLIYGINEGAQILAAYSFTGVDQNLSGPSFNDAVFEQDHVHGLAVNPDTNQLFYLSSTAGVRNINPDGTPGTTVLSSALVGSITVEDVAYFNGDYLVASYDNQLYFVDGITGAQSTLLNSTQLAEMGVTGYVSGVTVNFEAVPEPGTWILLLSGLTVVALLVPRMRKA